MKIKYGNTARMLFSLDKLKPLDMRIIEKVIFTFGKGNKQLIKEYPGSVKYIDNYGFLVEFSQEDMRTFNQGDIIEYDVKCVYMTGDVVSSKIGELEIEEVVNTNVY